MAERSSALRLTAALLVLAVALALAQVVGVQGAGPRVTTGHGLSIHGDLKYGPGFKHFEYANPDAPKGGDVRLAAIGTFDNLNRFILKGVPAAGIDQLFDTLTVASSDEPSSEYGLIAESVEVPVDRSWVTFTLRPEARFHDGSPITADDVIWTFQTLKTKGHPFYRHNFAPRHQTKRHQTTVDGSIARLPPRIPVNDRHRTRPAIPFGAAFLGTGQAATAQVFKQGRIRRTALDPHAPPIQSELECFAHTGCTL